MTTPFLDSNILLRHLTNDDPERGQACFALIQSIEQGKLSVWTSDLVIAEVVFVLSNKNTYNLGRDVIRDLLLPLINLPGLKLPHKRLYPRVFELYTTLLIDYIDAYHVALMERGETTEVLSYDKHFDRVEGHPATRTVIHRAHSITSDERIHRIARFRQNLPVSSQER